MYGIIKNTPMVDANGATATFANDLQIQFGLDANTNPTVCLQHLIQKRAYEHYIARGGEPGREMEDWLRAEHEIKHHFNI
jgi:hypothetical protein